MKRMIPGLIALAASAISAAGLYCAVTFVICMGLGGPDAYPISIPISMAGIWGCMGLFLLVGYLYVRLCIRQERRWLLLADIICFLLSFFPFFNLWRIVANYLSIAV